MFDKSRGRAMPRMIRRAVSALLAAVVAACATPSAPPAPAPADPAAGRSAARAPLFADFAPAMRCMDGLMAEYGVRDVSVLVEDLTDADGRVGAGSRDLLASVVGEFTQRSRAIRLVAVARDWTNTAGLLANVADREPLSVVPQYALRGSLALRDDGRLLGLDMILLSTADMTVVPGVGSRTAARLVGDGRAELRKAGLVFAIEAADPAQAVRPMTQLAAIEVFGRLVKVPYWSCLGATDADPGLAAEIQDWYDGMAARPELLIAWFQRQLRLKRVYEGPVDGAVNEAFKSAVSHYRGLMGLSAEPKLSLDFFQGYLRVDHLALASGVPAEPFTAGPSFSDATAAAPPFVAAPVAPPTAAAPYVPPPATAAYAPPPAADSLAPPDPAASGAPDPTASATPPARAAAVAPSSGVARYSVAPAYPPVAAPAFPPVAAPLPVTQASTGGGRDGSSPAFDRMADDRPAAAGRASDPQAPDSRRPSPPPAQANPATPARVVAGRVEVAPLEVAPVGFTPQAPVGVSAAAAPLSLRVVGASGARPLAPGEAVSFYVRPSRPAHVYCFLQDEERRVMRIFPNRFRRDSHVGDEGVHLPGDVPFQIRMNTRRRSEAIACFATPRDVLAELPGGINGGDLTPLSVGSLDEVGSAFDAAAVESARGALPMDPI